MAYGMRKLKNKNQRSIKTKTLDGNNPCCFIGYCAFYKRMWKITEKSITS